MKIPSKQFSSLGLGSNILRYIPIGINLAVSTRVERLNLAGNYLVHMDDQINHFPNMGATLKYLILSQCFISTIEDNYFKELKVLEYINLSRNNLKQVPKAVKKPTIIHLDLSNQCWWTSLLVCGSFELDADSFDGMDGLRKLDLRGNLKEIEANVFAGAVYLEELDISSIFLTHVHKDAFLKNSRLRKLRCSQCWILEALNQEMWNSVYNLEELDLSYSPHSLIPQTTSSNQESTKMIEIFLPNLKKMNLTCSLVLNSSICDEGLYQYESPLDPNMLRSMVKLETLDLSTNGLTSWPVRRFEDNTNLKHLSLSNNRFKSLTQAMLEDFKQLEYLDFR